MSACEWCGRRGKSTCCHACRGVVATLDREPGYEHALTGGTWHTRPGGIKVWVPWEGAA